MAEILFKRGLVVRSDSFSGVFGIFCLLNVGWPYEIELETFEAQTFEIAAESVNTWTTASMAEKEYEKPSVRWQYVAPSNKEKFVVFCCCAGPATANRWRVTDGYKSGRVALTSLKKQEGDFDTRESKSGPSDLLTTKVTQLETSSCSS